MGQSNLVSSTLSRRLKQQNFRRLVGARLTFLKRLLTTGISLTTSSITTNATARTQLLRRSLAKLRDSSVSQLFVLLHFISPSGTIRTTRVDLVDNSMSD